MRDHPIALDEAQRLAAYQRPGVKLIVGPAQASERRLYEGWDAAGQAPGHVGILSLAAALYAAQGLPK